MPTEDDPTTEAKHRSAYLYRATDLSRSEDETVAWKELGFSPSGIAKRIDSTDSTVSKRLDRTAAQYGLFAVHTKPPEERRKTDLSEPTSEGIDELAPKVRENWFDIVRDHPDAAPDWAVDRIGAQ